MTFTEENQKKELPERSFKSVLLRHWWIWLSALLIVAIGIGLFMVRSGKTQLSTVKQTANPPSRSIPVVAVAATKGEIGVYLNGLGSVTPLNTVTVRSRVDGQLMKVLFREGQIVKSGDLLAEIDPRPYEVQLTQAEGQMVRDQALLTNARLDLQRYETLVAQDLIPKQQLDTQAYLVHQYEGAVKTDQGQIDNAKLQIIYSKITAPVSGRVGLRLVDPGNIIHATDQNGMLVITQLEPISVVFSIPEDDLPKVLMKLKTGERLSVEVYDREQQKRLATGLLLTIDNQIDPTTGTVRLKAIFPNKDNELFPNQFVNARLLYEVKHEAIIVPAAAIQRGPQGTFVYLVKDDRTVSVRPVTIGVIQEGDVSIAKGLSPGELVVIDGAERLREGSKVDMKDHNGGATSRPS